MFWLIVLFGSQIVGGTGIIDVIEMALIMTFVPSIPGLVEQPSCALLT